jgi:predicted ATPase
MPVWSRAVANTYTGPLPALEERFPDVVETEPETVAHHLTEAGITDEAIDYWRRAGQIALARSAYPEAVRHLTKALELLTEQKESPEHRRKELSRCCRWLRPLAP